MIQGEVRSILATDIPGWEGTLQRAVARFAETFPDNPQHVSIIARYDDGCVESEDNFQDFLDRRRLLEEKNSKAKHVSSQVVSSQ